MPAAVDFALAKIQPPRPRIGLIERPVLEAGLARALRERRLVLLVAPAGYGKTAALTRQIRSLPEGSALAWICADEDDQLRRFLACLAAALEPFDLPWRVAPEALAMLAEDGRGIRSVAAELVNALAASEVPHGLIVVDDAHRIEDPRVFALLQALLDRLPERWTLVVSSRVEPPLALARLRVSGDLAEFRQDELRFGEAEVRALVDSLPADPRMPRPSVAELLQRTEGWPVGLRLSLNVPVGVAPQRLAGVTQRHLFDYLAAEVLDGMPEALRLFLLRCSVLPELTVGRCARVSGDALAARRLEEIERRGLFVSVLQADEPTLRLHDLVRDFLQDRLQRDHASEVPALLRRAAADEADPTRAVPWLARAGAWDEAAQALRRHGEPMFMRGAGATVEQLLSLFPPALTESRPDLSWLQGLAAMQHLDFDELHGAMARAAAGFDRQGRVRDAALARAYVCLGLQHRARFDEAEALAQQLRELPLDDEARAFVLCASVWSAYVRAEPERVAPLYERMLDALEASADATLWHRCAIVSVLIGLPGMDRLLRRFADGALRIAGDAPSELQCSAMHIHAWLAIGDGTLDAAAAWLDRADDAYRWLGMTRGMNHSNGVTHLVLDALRGDRASSAQAAQRLTQDLDHSPASHRRSSEYLVRVAQAQAAWVLQDAAALHAADAALARAADPSEWRPGAAGRRLVRALAACADGRTAAARPLLESLAADVSRGTYFPAPQARLMLADLLARGGDLDAAAQALRPWLADMRQSAPGAPGGALLAGQPVLERLSAVDWGQRLDAADLALLGGVVRPFPAAAAVGAAPPASDAALAPTAPGAAGTDPHLARLSEREREVLERIALGDGNKLIARALDLSPHTVKRHVANILDKLGAATRGQAAARWRAR